jgi:transposase InsO family protein
LRAATLESRLEELDVLRSFSRPRVSNDNPYSESLFHTLKYRPDYPSRPFAGKAEACEWVAAFVDWYNHHQPHSGAAIAISRERTHVYEKARQAHPNRWSQSIRCWHQPVVVWINKPPEAHQSNQALPFIQVT